MPGTVAHGGKGRVAGRQTRGANSACVLYHPVRSTQRGGIGVTDANIRIFFLTVAVLALLILAFLLASPAFA